MESFIREGLHIVNEMPIHDMKYIDETILNHKEDSLFNLIGEGSSGKVYRYKKYAIKIFHDHVIEGGGDDPLYPYDAHFLELLDRSPYFPSVYYYINKHYLVMEYIEGKSIYSVDSQVFVRCVSKLREAITYAFSRGLISSDLIDANIIVNNKNIPVIVDVGCFSLVSCDEEIERITEEYFQRNRDKILLDVLEQKEGRKWHN